jgi:serine/threonine protein kinase
LNGSMSEVIQTKIGGRYEIRERIGAGGMARVFKAFDVNLDRWVAVKILHEHLVDDPSFKERFTREAKFVASLNHPHIVQIYDYNAFERDGIPVYYMVMPFINGPTLRGVIDNYARINEPLPAVQACKIFLELCDALGYAHEQGMAHRDIKPGNVMIDSSGRTILTDFGIARMITAPRLTQDSVATGTPAYMSPEQIHGEAGDSRSDLYSLGIMLFELLTGKLPYQDEGGLSLVLKHLHAPLPRYSDVSGKSDPQLDLLFTRVLAKDPNERFQTAGDFALALRQSSLRVDVEKTTLFTATPTSQPSIAVVTSTAPMQTPPLGTAPQPAQPVRHTYRWLSFALVVVAASLVFIGWQQSQPAVIPSGIQGNEIPNIIASENVNQEAFTTTFEQGEPDLALWTQGDDQGIERAFDFAASLYRLTN